MCKQIQKFKNKTKLPQKRNTMKPNHQK